MADPDSDTEPEGPNPKGSLQATSRPTTPGSNSVPRRGGALSPAIRSPTMSLHSVGMSPMSPLRHRLSAPGFRSSTSSYADADANGDADESDVDSNLTQDNKDVLVQRLNSIITCLHEDHRIRDEEMFSLHAKVNEMETALSSPRRRRRSRRRWRKDDSLDLHTLSDVSSVSSLRRDILAASREGRSFAYSSNLASERMQQLASEAQQLNSELEAVIKNLRARQEETDHIHELLIMRAERAAQRIIFLEDRVKDLEKERNQGEMEMLNLQIQLKAIEVQCLSYVPKDTDQDLRESISSWRTEWSAYKRQRARRRQTTTPESPSRREEHSPD
ncbi:hypothetical protein F4780DRAFT_669634 [Xylariomycetidae sp. FL0641]|nr:hypothetical protein F4780DRAFT_669634 [Xylariomycetidae sp. FL0641]